MKKEEITLKNTKAEILDALNDALEREKNINKVKSNPIDEENVKKTEKIIQETRKDVESDIFSETLVKKFKNLELAISEEEEKLKNLYGVEKELTNLTLVMNTGKDVLTEIENKKKDATNKLNEEIKQLENEYSKKNIELQAEYDLKSKSLKTEREREVEEYNYKTKRERELANNKWEDEKKTREANLKNMEIDVKKRLDEVANKETYLKDLEKQVAEFSNLLIKEYERGKKETTLILEKENNYQMELLKKEFQSTIDRQKDKIESLQEEITKINNLNNSLQDKIDKAYIEVKELATKTVEANGGVKIIGNNSEIKN